MAGSGQRDRHGRGVRAGVLPRTARVGELQALVPAFRTRTDRFDDAVRAAFERLEAQWPEQLAEAELAVEEVPPPSALTRARESASPDGFVTDVTPGGAVPLGRVRRASDSAPPRFVIYRRPVEVRADGRSDLGGLVHEVLVGLVSELLGIDPDEVDPPP